MIKRQEPQRWLVQDGKNKPLQLSRLRPQQYSMTPCDYEIKTCLRTPVIDSPKFYRISHAARLGLQRGTHHEQDTASEHALPQCIVRKVLVPLC